MRKQTGDGLAVDKEVAVIVDENRDAEFRFAFPGPADYPPASSPISAICRPFAAASPLGPILEEQFGMPVFINNDGDLFVYGEAISGFLPYVNGLLAEAGSPKRYRNLFGADARHRPRRRHRAQRRAVHWRQLGGGRGVAAAEQARARDQRGRRRLDPRRAARLRARGRHSVRAGA